MYLNFKSRMTMPSLNNIWLLMILLGTCSCQSQPSYMTGFIVESELYATYNGTTFVMQSDTDLTLRVFGQAFSSSSMIRFTPDTGNRFDDCDDLRHESPFDVSEVSVDSTSAVFIINLSSSGTYMFCLKDNTTANWQHQGSDRWLTFRVEKKPSRSTLLPLPVQLTLVAVLLLCSGLFSGLNLGLMSLDKTELKILRNSGTDREKSYAKIVASVRKHGNYLLCTILLGNVLVNNTLTILMDDMTGNGPIAVLIATAGIVVFGEIVPQAICSRYGLAIGAKTIWFTRFFMFITFPLSFPISKILDWILGKEMSSVYNRDRLRELIKESSTDLKKDEMNIITGALELSKKTVVDIMTQIEDVYMLELGNILDFDTVSEIMATGYTRIPVFEGNKNNIVNILNTKDLALIDPDDRTPLTTVCKFYNHETKFVYDDYKLDEMLEEFKKGQYHMAFVRRVISEGTGDPYYEIIGVVTLEDIIEEIIQCEIMDETDTVTDNRSKARRKNPKMQNFSLLKGSESSEHHRLSPQLLLASLQFLSTAVPAFKPEIISQMVLQKLLKQNVVFAQRFNARCDDANYLYRRGKSADYFILIVEGRAEVEVGRDGMTFEAGPFTHFGLAAIIGPSALTKQQSISNLSTVSDSLYMPRVQYCPDFSVKIITDIQYIRINRAHYVAAKRATAMERRGANESTPPDDAFQKEWSRAISVTTDSASADEQLRPLSVAAPTQEPDTGSRPDAGTRVDTGTRPDAGTRVDTGSPPDAGTRADTGSRPDAGSKAEAAADRPTSLPTDAAEVELIPNADAMPLMPIADSTQPENKVNVNPAS